jgi:hypothetical protein
MGYSPYSFEVGGDSCVQSQKSVVHNTPNWKDIEHFHEQVVDLFVVLIENLCSEIEELGHLATLVVSSEHQDCFWIV